MNKLSISNNNGITVVTLNNPPANVITIDLINEINSFVLSLKDDRDTKVVVFKSANDNIFLAHLDVTVINGTPGGQAACVEFSHMIANIKEMHQASIAIVDGVARGGGNEFAMSCDLAYGTENAVFAQPEIFVNIPTGGQGAVQFARRMGKNKALQALLVGTDFNAQQAEALNIITQFVPRAEIENYVNSVANIINRLEVRDIMMCKEIIHTAVQDERAGAELELRNFLIRAKEEKTQIIIRSFMKHGGQTEREGTDFQGIFKDVGAELSKESE
jgi:enoyl-CoA hydratase/carnithine racemase